MIEIPGRIPVLIFPVFWIFILMIGWLNSGTVIGTALWGVVILFSVLIHEYGHALTARAFGQEAEIHLIALGGLTKREGAPLSRWKEFLIIFNGPAAGLTLFAIAYYFSEFVHIQNPFLVYSLIITKHVNLFWTLLNLLPVLPLDGGHLLRVLLEGAFGYRGLKISFCVSLILAVCLGIYFFLIQQLLAGSLFLMMAFEAYKNWSEIGPISMQDQDDSLQQMLRKGIEEFQKGYSKEALEKFVYIRQQAPKGILYVTATQYAAHILIQQGNIKQAYNWLLPLQNRLPIEYLRVLHQLAYRMQEWEEAIKIGQNSYQQQANQETALLNAFTYAILGQAVPSIGWLRCAIQFGSLKGEEVIQKREFDAIRASDAFQSWSASFKKINLSL
jgi:stage IV sporulation protein FB